MRKNYLVLAACCTAALFAACSSDDDNNGGASSTPAKAVIAGVGANACPAESVILATVADGATSFVWYSGDTKIAGATGANYEVTASGNYSAAGVNADGEGPRSDMKAVIISSCATAPVKAVIVGGDANACPATDVLLTAVASGAASYKWYNGATVITGATAATYVVTATGNYSAAGVNDVGEGEKSDPKAVTISVCATAPAKATVTGDAANACPATAVLLTAAATDATSYKWYNGTTEITGATAATYSVTATGTYSAAGVNSVGTGEKSDAKGVTISSCGAVAFADLLGYYNATGTPSILELVGGTAGPAAWKDTIRGSSDQTYYQIANFGNTGLPIWVDYNAGGVLTLDTYTNYGTIASGAATYYLTVMYLKGGGSVQITTSTTTSATITYDPTTQTLDLSGTSPTGEQLLVGIAAYNPTTEGVTVGTEFYANLKYVKAGAGSPGGLYGTPVRTGLPRETIQKFEAVKSENKLRAVLKQ
jgi:hypothetical protein